MKKVFILLLFILLSFNVYLVSNEKSTITVRNINKKEKTNKIYQEYKIGDVININDEPWHVIKNSNKDIDYVTVINLNYNRTIKDCLIKYDNLNEKNYFEGEYLNNLNINVKVINGYKVRLITLDEYKNLVKITNEEEKYTYNIKFNYDWVKDINTLTMDDVYHHYDIKDSCISWYINGNLKKITSIKKGYINIQPVINILKEEKY